VDYFSLRFDRYDFGLWQEDVSKTQGIAGPAPGERP
jgi:hypothetical protein